MSERRIPFLGWLLPAAAAVALLIAVLGWHIVESHRFFGEIGDDFTRETQALVGVRARRAELTQAAHHVVLFGPEEGRERAYEEAARGLAAELAAHPALAAQAPELIALTERLGAIERQAIAAALAGRQAEALDLLHSPEYMEQSRLLCAQADAQSQAVYARLNQRLREHGWSALAFFAVDIVILLFAVGLWWGLGVRLKRWRGVAEQELSRRLSTEAQLRQSQKMEALGQMAAGVGHDFKNVLGAIQGYADLALRAADRGSVDRASLDGIRAAAEQGTAVTGALLAFSQKAGPEWAPVDLWGLVTETARLLRPMLPDVIEVAVETRLPEEECRVLGDRAQLQQALVNLAINAGEAMPEGGRVLITLDSGEPGRVCLSVSDSGKGIPPELRERIFEPFFTTKARGQGTGLGLAIVHAIAASHGATVDLSSTPGQGTRFRLCLARAGSDSPEPAPAPVAATRTALIAARDPYQGALLASAVSRAGLATELVSDWDGLLAALNRPREGTVVLVLEEGFAGRGPAACVEAVAAGPGLGRVLVLVERGSPVTAGYEEAGWLVLERPLALAEVARLVASGGAPR
jgi:signal transduction histidine kinase